MNTLNDFSVRLTEFRTQKGISARDMSLSLGMSPSYINQLENGRNYPSLPTFFDICDFLSITPQEFFDNGNSHPGELREILEDLKQLDDESFDAVRQLIKRLK